MTEPSKAAMDYHALYQAWREKVRWMLYKARWERDIAGYTITKDAQP